jgi:gliding motility-associated-like protein
MRGIIIVILLLPLIAFPQGKRANNWYFGWYAGITFNQGSPPVALTDSKMLADFLAGSATISNTLGEMQFYTEGVHVWNKINEPMLNAGIIGSKCEQGAIIVPQPDHPNIYYLFNTEQIVSASTRYKLQYSIIDMNLDNGNGAILPGYRCVQLDDTIVGMFTAVLHKNQKDIWVLSHKQGNNKFYAYLVTSAGLIDTPVESSAGSVFTQAWGGLMKFSPDGSKVATTQNHFEILNFNHLTGIVSDNNIIQGDFYCYGFEFSPDNSLFYVSDQNTGIFQYDMKAGSEAEILATKFQLTGPTTSSSLQLGPDGKIYISPNVMTYLSAIKKPNIVGSGCEFELNAVDLAGKMNSGRLPTFIQSYMADPKYTTTSRCFGQPTQFKIVNTTNVDSVLWEFHDPANAPNDISKEFDPKYTFSGPGIYYPKLTTWGQNYIKSVIDTVVISEIPHPDLGSDTLICPGEIINLTLNGGSLGQCYWNGSLTPGDSTYLVTSTGEYRVKVDNHGCIGSDAIQVLLFDAQQIALSSYYCEHNKGFLTIFPQIGNASDYTYSLNGVDYLANEGQFINLPEGDYSITLKNQSDCISAPLSITIDCYQGDPLLALADTARECLHQPANSDIKIARANGMLEMKAVLYYNNTILNCTNFNKNEADFPGINAMIYSSPSRVEISWNGIKALSSADTLLLGSLIFESYDDGVANVDWDDNRAVTWFLDAAGDSIEAELFPGEVEVHELPAAAIDAPLSVCEGDSARLIALVSGGTDPFELQWTTPSGSSFSDTINLDSTKLTDSGKYTLTVSDRFHCTGNSEVIFNVIPLPTAGFPDISDTIPFEQTYILEATQGYSSYQWSTGDTTYFINVTVEGDYTVTMLTEEGCEAAEAVYMLETYLPIKIPNAFTPNDDGLNDTFKPLVNVEMVNQFSMSIYNKWGQRIFETSQLNDSWDGKNAFNGVYQWVIEYQNMLGKVYKLRGLVHLIK